MARSYRPVVRDQEYLLPPNMADWLPRHHLVWFVLEVVSQLDTTRFHARSRRGGVGRQGYNPDMLLGLLLYSYAVGERSSRRIERLCIDHVAFRVACGQDAPDHTTIARFRADHQDAFADLFAQVLRLCSDAGMVKVGVIAIDGTKIAANASRGANRTREHLTKEAGAQARRIAEDIIADAADVDAAEQAAAKSAGQGASSGDDDLPPGFTSPTSRAANIAAAIAELKRQDAVDQVLDTDEQDRLSSLLTRLAAGEIIGGRVPAGIDPVAWFTARITGFDLQLSNLIGVRGPVASRTRRDLRQRRQRAQRSLAAAMTKAAAGEVDIRGLRQRKADRRQAKARARGGTGTPSVNVTDPDSRLMTAGSGGGSVQGYNAQLVVTNDHLVLGIHVSQDANDTHCYAPAMAVAEASCADLDLTIGIALLDAGYFTEENLTTPGPERLISPGKTRDLNKHINPETPTGTPAEPGPQATAKDRMRHRLKDPDNAAIYKRRSATVENVIAHIKDRGGLRRFSRRGLPATTAELHLAAAVHNLRRMHTTALSNP